MGGRDASSSVLIRAARGFVGGGCEIVAGDKSRVGSVEVEGTAVGYEDGDENDVIGADVRGEVNGGGRGGRE